MLATPNQAASVDGIVRLSVDGPARKVVVTLPDQHVMVMAVGHAVEACRAFQNQLAFRDQFQSLIHRLGTWIFDHQENLDKAYITSRDAGLLFLVVRKDTQYCDAFEDELTDLDLEVANDPDYDLIRLEVIALPAAPDESILSFLAHGKTLQFTHDG